MSVVSDEMDRELVTAKARFHAAAEQKVYRNAKASCEDRVTRWEWATDEMLFLEPFEALKSQHSVGKWSSKGQRDMRHQYEHGFDESGSLCVVRAWSGAQFGETFVLTLPGCTEVLRYDDHDKKPIGLTRILPNAKCTSRIERVGVGGHGIEDYSYGEAEILMTSLLRHYNRRSNQLIIRNYEYHYDELGRICKIDATEQVSGNSVPITSYVLYERPQKSETTRSLLIAIESLLISSILDILRRAAIAPKVYCLLLVYDKENHLLPPELALGEDRLRRAAVEKHGAHANQYIWNPADFAIFASEELSLDRDEKLSRACRLVNQELHGKTAFSDCISMLNRVAAILMKANWQGILNCTDDFVVVATDLEAGDDLSTNIKRSVPVDLRKRLKRDGLL